MNKGSSINDLRSKNNSSPSSVKPPKLCKVCNRASFLKCMECDTIYCSSKCQIRDWDDHQKSHSQPHPKGAEISQASSTVSLKTTSTNDDHQKSDTQQRPKGTGISRTASTVSSATQIPKRQSVQERLKTILQKAKSTETEPQNVSSRSSQTTIEKVSEDFSMLNIDENYGMEDFKKKSQMIRNFLKPVDLSLLKDRDGYVEVKLSYADENLDGYVLYYVIQSDTRALDNYLDALTATYSSNDLPNVPLHVLHKFRPALVMAVFKNRWSRTKILNISLEDGVISLQSIDTGEKTIKKLPKDSIKMPLEDELKRPAYAVKVAFENVMPGKVTEGDIVNIKFTELSEFGTSWAEVEFEDDAVDQDVTPIVDLTIEDDVVSTVEQNVTPPPAKPSKIFIDSIKARDLPVGKDVKLLYCEGSELEKGKLHVCENDEQNWNFYVEMLDNIAAYILKNPPTGFYKPEQRELVLIKFTDGSFYRAVCLDTKDSRARVRLLEYGSIAIVPVNEIIPMPPKLAVNICSHTVQIKLASGWEIDDINVKATQDKFNQENSFTAAEVRKEDGKGTNYTITIDDSCVVVK